jgi:hypothetical protein
MRSWWDAQFAQDGGFGAGDVCFLAELGGPVHHQRHRHCHQDEDQQCQDVFRVDH